MFGRKKKKQAKKLAKSDPLGGFSIEQLFGLDPVTEPKKRGVVSKVLGLPVALAKAPIMIVQRLIGGVLNAVVEVLKLPVRVLGGIARPWRRS